MRVRVKVAGTTLTVTLTGQHGDGSKDEFKISFTQVMATGAWAVAAGGGHTVVLKQDGSVWVAGRNQYGELGIAKKKVGGNENQRTFVRVISSGVKSVAARRSRTMVRVKVRVRVRVRSGSYHPVRRPCPRKIIAPC